MSQGSIGGINVATGSTALTLATTATLLNCWNTSAGSNQDYSGGSVEVRPDKANNRVIVAGPANPPTATPPTMGSAYGNPPTATYKYRVHGYLSGTCDGTFELTLQLRKAGTVVATCICKRSWTVTINNMHDFEFLVEVTSADVLGTIDPNPSASTAAPYTTNPAGSFAGATGNPKVGVALDIMLTANTGTPAITVVNGEMIVERLAI